MVAASVIVAGLIAFLIAGREPRLLGPRGDVAAMVAWATGATFEPIQPAAVKSLGLLQPQVRGLVVTSIAANGPARTAGLRVGDVVERIGEVRVSSLGDFESALRRTGGPLSLTMVRGGNHAIMSLQPRPTPDVAEQGAGR